MSGSRRTVGLYIAEARELLSITALEALDCPPRNNRTIVPRLEMIYNLLLYGEVYNNDGAGALSLLSYVVEIVQISRPR